MWRAARIRLFRQCARRGPRRCRFPPTWAGGPRLGRPETWDALLVFGTRDLAGIGARRRDIERRRRDLAKRLMGALLVVDAAEGVERPLLIGKRRCWRAHRRLLERPMEAFEAPVLFGVTGRDAFGRDAQFDEVDGESGEPAEAGGCERRAVVGSDDGGEPPLAEGALDDGEDVGERWARESFAGDEEAGVGVDDRERVDAGAVACARPALEVDGPAVVGGVDVGEGVGEGRRAA